MKILTIALITLIVAAVSMCGCCSCCKLNPISGYDQGPVDTPTDKPTDTPTYQSSTHTQNGEWVELSHISKILNASTLRYTEVKVTELPLTIKLDISSDSPITVLIMDDDNFKTFIEQGVNGTQFTVDYLVDKTNVTNDTFEYKCNGTGSYWVVIDNTGKVDGASTTSNTKIDEVISVANI